MLTERDKEAIRSYQYRGGDTSLLYRYALSPFAQFCVDYLTPRSVAPNVITLTGLLFSLFTAILTLIVNPTLGPGAPSWLHFLTALTIFSYQTLDNMDGKQARRTVSSSALGMLFDHACDAINASVSIISMGSVLGTGWSHKFFIAYLSSYTLFFTQTWEEYFTNEMILAIFNGPSEGLMMAVLTSIVATVYGSEVFSTVRRF
jgi:ethanolaminephosphotransferase